MTLKALEKIGAIVAFIPLVSTISGIIKVFVYNNKIAHNNPEKRQKTEKTAQKTEDVKAEAQEKLEKVNVKSEKIDCYKKLYWSAIAEVIPGVNIIAAICSAVFYNDLSTLRDINQNENTKTNYIKNKYRISEIIDKINDDGKKRNLLQAIIVLDNLEPHPEIPNEIVFKIKKSIAQQISKEFLHHNIPIEPPNYEVSKEKILANALVKQYLDNSIIKLTRKIDLRDYQMISEDRSLEDTWKELLSLKREEFYSNSSI